MLVDIVIGDAYPYFLLNMVRNLGVLYEGRFSASRPAVWNGGGYLMITLDTEKGGPLWNG